MADEIKCPVCGKVGIPDYHAEDTVCPQCGSDLSIFRVIDQIPQTGGKKSNVWMPIAAVAILTTAVLGGVLLFKEPKVSTTEDQSNRIACLQDSINVLKSQLEESTTTGRKTQYQPKRFKYVVVKGDCLWSISKRFYNTGKYSEEIASANGLDKNSKLLPGDTIIINQ